MTRSLVMVRKLTGQLEPNSKYSDLSDQAVGAALDYAELLFDSQREVFIPVVVI